MPKSRHITHPVLDGPVREANRHGVVVRDVLPCLGLFLPGDRMPKAGGPRRLAVAQVYPGELQQAGSIPVSLVGEEPGGEVVAFTVRAVVGDGEGVGTEENKTLTIPKIDLISPVTTRGDVV